MVPRADCSDELWSVSALFAGLGALGGLVLLPAALRWRSYLRWCAVPAAALWVLGGLAAATLLGPGSLEGRPLCEAMAGAAPSGAVASIWQRAWPPLQLAVIALCAWQALRYWLPDREPSPR